MKVELGALYPILDWRDARTTPESLLIDRAAELAAGGAALLQLRAKSLGARAFTELARAIGSQIRATPCKLLVNDRVDVAFASGADGVHLGDSDLPPAAARRILGADKIIGYSTHSPEEAKQAPLEADYLGFGPVGESPTKAGVRQARGIAALAEAVGNTTRPVVAIGGMTLEQAPEVFATGALSVAVIREIETSDDLPELLGAYARAAAQ